jgi:DNA-binding GntR family transcriptional regulator
MKTVLWAVGTLHFIAICSIIGIGYYVTADEFKSVQSNTSIHFETKQEALDYVMSRFTESELKRYKKMAADGLTITEKKQLYHIALQRLSRSEIQAIREAFVMGNR